MAISEQRISLFALISEFEADARDIVAQYICDDHSIKNDLGQEAYDLIKMRAAANFSKEEVEDRALLTYLDIGDSIKLLLSNRALLPAQIGSALTKVAKDLQFVPGIRNRVMHRRPIEFDDFPLTLGVVRTLSRAGKKEFSRSKTVIEALSSEETLRLYEKSFSYESEPSVLNNLPQPDFEDTGFMGRVEQIEDLKKAISGPFPVITVLGVGGAGKSALALHVAYDILNQENCPYDAIIWTSAKTTRLTGADVEEISGAISTSVGVAEAALAGLGEGSSEDPFESIREFLNNFRILLFIDNLETILDERVRAFVRDIPSGSKVVFTSRVGLGAYDFVVPIKNLGAIEAARFFRRVVAVWKQAELQRISNDDLSSYCLRLNYSPLGIKWFVQAVSAGAAPQRLLANPEALLNFCLENIIDKISSQARVLLNALAITGREQSPASLHYLSEIDPWDVEDALRELISSHLVSVVVSRFGQEDRYRISPLAQTYISRFRSPSANFQANVRARQTQLLTMAERAEAEAGRGFVYDPAYIMVRKEYSGTDSVAASYLRRALLAGKKKDYDHAFAEIDRAKSIAPSFFEVLRIEGYIAAYQGNTMRAQTAFEEAVALNPDHPPLLDLYAGFLLRSLGDGENAERILLRAVPIDPGAPQLRLELSRCQLYQLKFDDAWNTLRDIPTELLRNGRAWRMYYDLLVQTCIRSAERSLADEDSTLFARSFARLSLVVAEMPSYAMDDQTERRLKSAIVLARKFIKAEKGTEHTVAVEGTLTSICSVVGEPMKALSSLEHQIGGAIAHLPADKPYGFIDGDNGDRLFFHRNHLTNRNLFDSLKVGLRVTFSIGSNDLGPCAEEVQIIDE